MSKKSSAKEKKRKLRSKKKVRARREELRAAAREDKKQHLERRKWEKKLEREMNNQEPDPELENLEVDEKELAIKKRLEHNMEILAALQDEFEKEQETRKNVNDTLEAEGASSIEEKMELVKSKLKEVQELQQDNDIAIGGEVEL